jgi:hypothetical protein
MRGLYDLLMKSNMRMVAAVDVYLLDPFSGALTEATLWIVQRWISAIFVFAFAMACGYFLYLILVTHIIFWDFGIYVAAMKAMAAGKSPYDHPYIAEHFGVGQTFVYPPFIARILYLTWLFLTPAGAAGLYHHSHHQLDLDSLSLGRPAKKLAVARVFVIVCLLYHPFWPRRPKTIVFWKYAVPTIRPYDLFNCCSHPHSQLQIILGHNFNMFINQDIFYWITAHSHDYRQKIP